MSKNEKKKSRKNLTETIVLATAFFELIKTIFETVKEITK